VEVTSSQGTATNDAGVVRVELGDLGVSSNAVVTLRLRAEQVGWVTNWVRVAGAEADPQEEDNSASAVTAIKLSSDVGVSLVPAASPVLLGGVVVYELTVTNVGSSVARGVVMEDRLPGGVSFLEVWTTQGAATNEEGLVRVVLGELGVGSNAVVTLRVRAEQVGWVTNRVRVSSGDLELNAADNEVESVVEVVPAADVGVSLNVSAGEVLLGSEVVYEMTVTNGGPSGATGVELTDVMPSGWSFVAVVMSQGEATNDAGVVRVALGELSVGGSALVTLTLRADSLGPMTNTATVLAHEGDPLPENNTVAAGVVAKVQADIAVELSAAAGPVLAGNEVRFEARVSNVGLNPATAVVLVDEVPAGMGLVSVETSQGTATNDAGVVRVALGELGVGSNAVVALTLRADQPGWATNRAGVQMAEIDLNPENNTAEAAVEVQPVADLGVRVEDPASPVLLGSEGVYELTVTNGGPNGATGVELTDVLPAGLSLVEFTTSQGTATNDAGVVRVALGELGVSSNAVVTLRLRAEVLGGITNLVGVRALEADVDLTNNEAESVVEVVPAADLGLSMTPGPAEALLGSELVYQLTVTNTGPSEATQVVLEDVLPAGLSWVEVTSSQGTATNDAGVVRVELGDLGVSSNAVVALTLRAEALGRVTNTVSLRATEGDPFGANNEASAAVSVGMAADVGVTMTAIPNPVFLGRELSYAIGVTNLGPGPADSLVLEDVLPRGVELLDLELSQGTATHENGVVRTALGGLGAGGTALVTLRVRAQEPGDWTNRVRVLPHPLDPNAANDEALTPSVVLPYAGFRLTQTASPSPVLVNDSLRYALGVSNAGPYEVLDARLTDTLPDGVELQSASSSQGTYSTVGNVVTYDLGPIAAGVGVDLVLTVTPRSVGLITNVAVLSSAFADPADSALTSRAISSVVATPPLTYTLSGTKFMLHWPALASDYRLETTSDLVRQPWIEDPNPRVVEGDRITVTVKTFGSQAYYRLRKP
jgi:uncharacterized repeat protein (TIGR01451 family)